MKIMTKAVEKYYTISDTSCFLALHPKTVTERMKAGALGPDCVNLGSPAAPDYRIPASGINCYLDASRLAWEPGGIPARNIAELRRKVAAMPRDIRSGT